RLAVLLDRRHQRVGGGEHVAELVLRGDPDLDLDRVGDGERRVLPVADLEAQRVGARLEVDRAGRGAGAEVDVVGGLGDRRAGVEAAVVGDHVEVALAGGDLAGRDDRDALGSHLDVDGAGDPVAVAGRDQGGGRPAGTVAGGGVGGGGAVVAAGGGGGERGKGDQEGSGTHLLSRRCERGDWDCARAGGAAGLRSVCAGDQPGRFTE